MNFFSSRAFLEALGDASYGSRRRQIETIEVAGAPFRVLTLGARHQPVHAVPFLDYLEPTETHSPTRQGRYLQRTAVDCFPVKAARALELEPREILAPLLKWDRFQSWSAFEATAKERWGPAFKLSERHKRKLEKDFGPVRFEPHVADRALFEPLFAWKSAQYRQTGLIDILARDDVKQLFENLLTSGNLLCSVLFVNDAPAAIHAGALYEGRFYYWLPAYDPAFRQRAPGTVLLEELLKWSHAQGHRVFDFLLGDEPYKWVYSTHAMLVAPRGEPPASLKAYRVVRSAALEQAKRHPELYEKLQAAKRRYIERHGFF